MFVLRENFKGHSGKEKKDGSVEIVLFPCDELHVSIYREILMDLNMIEICRIEVEWNPNIIEVDNWWPWHMLKEVIFFLVR